MKKGKSYICVLCVLVVLILLTACAEPPVCVENSSGIDRYLQVNNYVKERLSADFKGVLPSVSNIDKSSAKYFYEYNCTAVGNPGFVIYLETTWDEMTLQQEMERLSSMAATIGSPNSQEKLYIMNDVLDSLPFYMDDEVQDGLEFCFEFALVNLQKKTVTYLTAVQCDEHPRQESVLIFTQIAAALE